MLGLLSVLLSLSAQTVSAPNCHSNPAGSRLLDSKVPRDANGYPLVWVWGPSFEHNFDIRWNNGAEVKTSLRGFDARLRVGTTSRTVTEDLPLMLSGITLQTSITAISDYSILISYKLTNSLATTPPTAIAVGIHTDTVVGGNETHHIELLPGNSGLFWSGDSNGVSYTIYAIGSQCPFVTDVSNFWFGDYILLPNNYWNQVALNSSDGTDVAFALSWVGVVLPAFSSKTLAVLFRSTAPGTPPNIDQVCGPGVAPISSTPTVTISISDTSGSTLKLYVIVDGDVGTLTCLLTDAGTGLKSVAVPLAPYALSVGTHDLAFYAVNAYGDISTGAAITLTGIVDPTPTASETPTMTSSPPPSRSLHPFPSPTPFDLSWPIVWVVGTGAYNFDVQWRNQAVIDTASQYMTMLRNASDGTTTYVTRGRPANISTVTIETGYWQLSRYTILVAFRLTNSDPAPETFDVAVFADTQVGTNFTHHVQRLPHDVGIAWGGVYADNEYLINVIGRDYPLVSYLSAFWFGRYSRLNSAIWNQTDENWSLGSDVGMSISWQGIAVPGSGSTTVSFLFRSGMHHMDQPRVREFGLAPLVVRDVGIPITFVVDDHELVTSLDIYVVVDDDIFGLTLVAANLTAPWGLREAVMPPLALGPHIVALYAINDFGFISQSEERQVEAVESLPTTDDGSNAGMIAGVTIAVIVVVALIAIGVWYLVCKKGVCRKGEGSGFSKLANSESGQPV